MTARQKVIVIFFSRSGSMVGNDVTSDKGELYLEKRPMGKWLCFKKRQVVRSIKLTKKSYKNLLRQTVGIRMERFYDYEDMDDEEYAFYYGNNCLTNPKYQKKSIEKGKFIIQVFQYVKNR